MDSSLTNDLFLRLLDSFQPSGRIQNTQAFGGFCFMRSGLLIAFLSATLLLVGCTTSGSADQAIESYIQALAGKDVVTATGISCLAWEESAAAEASSFEAVDVTLEEVRCTSSGSEGEFTRIECEGILVADYGGEIQDIDLSQRIYLAVQEQGEWKMCGYASK